MDYRISLFALFVAASATAASPFTSKQFRSDYEYNKNTDAFYKLHIEGAQYEEAIRICEHEGANLIEASSQQELIQIHSMFKKFPDLGEYVMIKSSGGHHDPVEEPMIDLEKARYFSRVAGIDVMNRMGEVETYQVYQALPFVCNVEAKDVHYNTECDVYSKDYVSKISTTGSCYRIEPTNLVNWNVAYANCQAEGAHLIILNSPGELEVVKNMLTEIPHTRYIYNWEFFAGIRAEKTEPRVFKTVLNQTLEELGYQPWNDGEPNNLDGDEYCVSITRRSGKYKDTFCQYTHSYVCEKERRVI